MRVFLLALAILLLPLRGWLGGDMATAMAMAAVQPATAAHTDHAAHAMPADAHATHDMASMSHGEAAAHSDQTSHPDQAAHDCQGACSDCQLCHSVAMTVWPALATVAEAPRTAPTFAPAAFASAEPAPGLKPPIS